MKNFRRGPHKSPTKLPDLNTQSWFHTASAGCVLWFLLLLFFLFLLLLLLAFIFLLLLLNSFVGIP